MAQEKKLENFKQVRRENANYLSRHLEGVLTPVEVLGYTQGYHQYTGRVPGVKRDELRNHLQARAIGSEVYYPVPVHLQQSNFHLVETAGRFACAEQATRDVISLPVHPSLKLEDLEQITRAVNEFSR